MITLLFSNLLSRPLKPIVILTDLRDDYIFYWLDGRTVFYCPADSPGIALGIIKSFLQQEEVTTISEVQPVQVCFALSLKPVMLLYNSIGVTYNQSTSSASSAIVT